jgi:SEL1 protein
MHLCPVDSAIKDFHLAKRYYDMALETNTEAYLPVVLSLIKLHLKSIWHTVSGGSQREKLLIWSEEPEGDSWYLGKSKADMKKKNRAREKVDGAQEGEDMDMVEWVRRKKDEEADSQGDFGPEDYFEGATRRWDRGEGEGDDDEDLETLVRTISIIILSC